MCLHLGVPQLFRGPLEHNGQLRHLFEEGVEARYVRLEPQTWKHAIALRFEVFGCDGTAPIVQRTTPAPVEPCGDQMGLENGVVHDDQIVFSSVDGSHSGVRLGSESSWKPAISSRKEHVRIDFLELRNLTGVITQGQPGGGAWVESFAGNS